MTNQGRSGNINSQIKIFEERKPSVYKMNREMNLLQLDNKKSRSDKIGRQTSDFKVNSLSKGGTDRQKIKLSVLIQMKKSKKADS